jgi:putative tryptophan/tyrosine transport system substrate-binding protein
LPETRIVEFVAANRLPAIYVWRWFLDSGVLMSYRPSSYELWQRAAIVDKILRGAQSPTFRSSSRPDRTVADLKTAKELGLTIPQSILARVNEVME